MTKHMYTFADITAIDDDLTVLSIGGLSMGVQNVKTNQAIWIFGKEYAMIRGYETEDEQTVGYATSPQDVVAWLTREVPTVN